MLYYPAKPPQKVKERYLSEADREQHIAFSYCMNGFVVDDKAELSRTRAMEELLREQFVPVSYKKQNEINDDALRTEEDE